MVSVIFRRQLGHRLHTRVGCDNSTLILDLHFCYFMILKCDTYAALKHHLQNALWLEEARYLRQDAAPYSVGHMTGKPLGWINHAPFKRQLDQARSFVASETVAGF